MRYSAPCHNDAMHNIFVQLHGRKRFRLYPPRAWEHLYVYPKFHLQHRNLMIELDTVGSSSSSSSSRRRAGGLKNFPLAEGVENLELVAELDPGDVLYVLSPLMLFAVPYQLSDSPSFMSINRYLPPLWFHQVKALSTSMSVNVWSASRDVERMNQVVFSLCTSLSLSLTHSDSVWSLSFSLSLSPLSLSLSLNVCAARPGLERRIAAADR